MSTFASRAVFHSDYAFTTRAAAEAVANGRVVVAACASNFGYEVRFGYVKPRSAACVEQGAKARSERHVYTPSGKKRTNKQVCLCLFKKFQDKAAFVAAAKEKGVKTVTAVTYFDDIKAGRVKA
jgi:hypothetical protein